MDDVKNVISLGAGVQSSTIALMCAHDEIKPMPDFAIFADTQNEPKAVYEWLDWLETQLPFTVHRVTKGNLWEASIRPRVSKKNGKTYFKFYAPTFTLGDDGKKSMLPRKCTTDFKLVPIYQALRKLVPIPRGCKTVKVKSWIGISLDEATRMKPSREPWAENVFPLIDLRMTRNDCKAWMKAHGYPEPPKSACIFCPYHNDAMWKDMKENAPEEFARAVQFEEDLEVKTKAFVHLDSKEFLHASRIPLKDVNFDKQPDPQINLFESDCEGMCGV